MSHMVRQLSELTSLIEPSPTSNSLALNLNHISPDSSPSRKKKSTRIGRNEIYGSDEDQSKEKEENQIQSNNNQNPYRLTLEITKESNTDLLLRSHAAEHAGMWITGTKCIVEIIASTFSLTPILLNDFEIAGGIIIIIDTLLYLYQII